LLSLSGFIKKEKPENRSPRAGREKGERKIFLFPVMPTLLRRKIK
jgi:hypothetical protein